MASLRSTLEATVSSDGVSFEYTVTNPERSNGPLKRQFRNSRQADLTVEENGEQIWRYSDRRAAMDVLTTLELSPGESKTYEFEWSDPEPGSYTAEAGLVSHGARARTSFTVP